MKNVLMTLCACRELLVEYCTTMEDALCQRQKACGERRELRRHRQQLTPGDDAVQRGLEALSTQCGVGDACAEVFTGTVALGGVCTARSSDDATVRTVEACNTDRFDSQSDSTAWCNGDRCAAMEAAGGACSSSTGCQLRPSCLDGQCGVPRCAP